MARYMMCAAVGFGCLLVAPAPVHAQVFVEVGGGWNYVSAVPGVTSFSNGSNIRASVGWQVSPNFQWRIDAFSSQFDAHLMETLPCPMNGCAPSAFLQSERVDGLTANGLVSVDQRGIFYLIGGAGLYLVTAQTWGANFGVSAGAGVAVPVAPRVRVVVEARWHGLLGTGPGPTSLVPITVGLRFR